MICAQNEVDSRVLVFQHFFLGNIIDGKTLVSLLFSDLLLLPLAPSRLRCPLHQRFSTSLSSIILRLYSILISLCPLEIKFLMLLRTFILSRLSVNRGGGWGVNAEKNTRMIWCDRHSKWSWFSCFNFPFFFLYRRHYWWESTCSFSFYLVTHGHVILCIMISNAKMK